MTARWALGGTMIVSCKAAGCSKVVPEKIAFCAPHWAMIPKTTQQAITTAYIHGQGATRKPSEAWKKAVAQAVCAIAKIEGVTVGPVWRQLAGEEA